MEGILSTSVGAGQRHQFLVCKLENERCAGAALSSEGSSRSRDAQCGPRSLRAAMLGFALGTPSKCG